MNKNCVKTGVTRILVVEDDELLRRALCRRLEATGYHPLGVDTAKQARKKLTGDASSKAISALAPINLALLDINLPDEDGFSLLRWIRAGSDVPVIVMSVRQNESDKIRALDEGADDYVTKPLHGGELLARIRAALRRGGDCEPEQLHFKDDITVDLGARAVFRHDQRVALTRTEWSLFERLVRHPGKLQTHEELLQHVWGLGFEGDSHYVRVYIASLRRKLGENARRPSLIATQQGVGYRWIGTPQ